MAKQVKKAYTFQIKQVIEYSDGSIGSRIMPNPQTNGFEFYTLAVSEKQAKNQICYRFKKGYNYNLRDHVAGPWLIKYTWLCIGID